MSPFLTRRLFLASGAAVAAFSTTLSGKAHDVLADTTIDEIHWGLPSVKDTMFVPRAWSTYVGAIMSLVQEGLLAFGDDLRLEAAAAESWKQTDPTTYVYTIRKGVTFGDGSPLTPDDVIASYKFHMDPKSGSQLAAFFSSVDTVTATGDNEVTVKLKAPNVQYQYTAAHMAGFLFKKSQLEGKIEDLGGPDELVLGTGPYKLVEFSPSEKAVLEARDDYWGPKPVAKRIVFTSIPDHQTRLLAMKNGDIDGTFDLAISEIDQWKALGNVDVITAPSLGVFSITLDQSMPPFDDIHVRKAIAYAVDREGLVKALLKGNGEAATALNPPEIWTGVLSVDEVKAFYATLPGYQFDMAKAKAELAQSKHADGFEITVPGSTSDPYMVNILQSVAENLKQLGIKMTVKEVDDNTWLSGYFRHEKLGMQVMPYYPDFADPANYPYLFLDSANATKDGMNGSNFKNADVDKAIDTADKEADPKVRADALKQAFKIANDEVALVPVFWPASAMAISNKYKLTGYTAFWYNIPWAIRGFGPK
ncbi:MAG TPA: ABC transporter substrate-binding protein [Dongiaceae bacterium]